MCLLQSTGTERSVLVSGSAVTPILIQTPRKTKTLGFPNEVLPASRLHREFRGFAAISPLLSFPGAPLSRTGWPELDVSVHIRLCCAPPVEDTVTCSRREGRLIVEVGD